MSLLLVEKQADGVELALMEHDALVSFQSVKAQAGPQPEAIYLGRVGRVMTNLQAAFVRITAREEAYLPFTQMRGDRQPKPGEPCLVQVKKAAVRGKAAYLTQDIALASRYAVLLPMGKGSHVSARDMQPEERKRLQRLAQRVTPDGMSVVLRSQSLLAAEAHVRAEVNALAATFRRIEEEAARTTPPALLLPATDPFSAILRDLREAPERILTNDPACVPDTSIPVDRADNPFLLYRVRDALSKALKRRVHLKSGGELVIDPCEAMTVMDVNTASATQDKDQGRTILTTNLEAVREAARIMRLRNIGGIVVMDLIDMPDPGHKQQVLDALAAALNVDPVKTVVHGFTSLGLLEITRRRTSEGLDAQRLDVCPACGGSGQAMTMTQQEET